MRRLDRSFTISSTFLLKHCFCSGSCASSDGNYLLEFRRSADEPRATWNVLFTTQRGGKSRSTAHPRSNIFSLLFTITVGSLSCAIFSFSNPPVCSFQNEPLTTRLRSLRPNKTKRQHHSYQTRSAHRPGTRSRNSRNRRNPENRMDSDSDGEVWSTRQHKRFKDSLQTSLACAFKTREISTILVLFGDRQMNR